MAAAMTAQRNRLTIAAGSNPRRVSARFLSRNFFLAEQCSEQGKACEKEERRDASCSELLRRWGV